MPKKLLKPTLETTNSNMQLETLSLALLLWHLGLFGVQLSQLNVYMDTLEYTNSNWGSLKAWSAPIYPKRFPKFTWEYSSTHHMQSYSLTQCAATACSSDTKQKGKEAAFFLMFKKKTINKFYFSKCENILYHPNMIIH